MIRRLNGAIHSIHAAALLLGAASLFSRILGVVRDRLLAGHFGASRELDIYYAAFQIPDFLFSVFLIGAGSAAIIPIFTRTRERDAREARTLIQGLTAIFFVGTVAVALLALILAPYLIRGIAPGFSTTDRVTTTLLTRIMLLSPIFLGLSNILSSVIQSYRRFFIYSLSAVFYNIGIIAGIVIGLPILGLTGLAVGVALGALLHFSVQIPTFRGLGYRLAFVPRPATLRHASREIRQILYLSLPRALASSLDQLTTVVLVALASMLAAGSISVFQFANNLRWVPIGIFGVSFAIASFPALAEYASRGNADGFMRTFSGTIRSTLFWVLPLGVLVYVLRAQIVRVALGAGRFGWTDTRLTAAILGVFGVSIIMESLVPIFIRSFYSLGNTATPLRVNLIAGVFTIGTAWGLVHVLQQGYGWVAALARVLRIPDLRDITVLGIALAVSMGSILNVLLLSAAAGREFRRKLAFHGNHVEVADVFAMVVAALSAGVAAFATLRVVNLMVTLKTFWGVFVQGAVAAVTGLLFYGAILYLSGNPEILSFLETLRRHITKIRILPQELSAEEPHP